MPHGDGVLAPHVHKTLGGTYRVRGDGQALNDAERIGLEYSAVHEGARVTLVAVADDVLGVAGSAARDVPLDRGRESGAAPASQASRPHLLDHVLRRQPLDALPQRLHAAPRLVLFERERRDLSAVLQHDTNLLGEVGSRIDFPVRDRHPLRVLKQPGPGAPDPLAQPDRHTARPEVCAHHLARVFRPHVAVQGAPAALDDFDERLAVAEAAATHRLHPRASPDGPDSLFECRVHFARPAGDPAGTEPDSYLDRALGVRRRPAPVPVAAVTAPSRACGEGARGVEMLLQHPARIQRLDVAINLVVDRDHRRQAARSQAGDRLDREAARRVGVRTVGDAKGAPQLASHLNCAGHVARRPLADPHRVLAHGTPAELSVE